MYFIRQQKKYIYFTDEVLISKRSSFPLKRYKIINTKYSVRKNNMKVYVLQGFHFLIFELTFYCLT